MFRTKVLVSEIYTHTPNTVAVRCPKFDKKYRYL